MLYEVLGYIIGFGLNRSPLEYTNNIIVAQVSALHYYITYLYMIIILAIQIYFWEKSGESNCNILYLTLTLKRRCGIIYAVQILVQIIF